MATRGIDVPISAEIDTQDTDREIRRLTDQLNKIGQAVAGINKVKFNPVDKGAVDDMRRVQAQFETIMRISPALRSQIKATGQAGAKFADVDWGKIYSPSFSGRGVALRGIYDRVTEGTAFHDRFVQSSPGGGGRPPGRPPQPAPEPDQPASFPGQNIVSAGLRAAGPVGQVGASALGAGLRGGLLAGAGAMLGGLGVLAAAKGVGAVFGKTGDAEQESIGYDTLKRVLGDVNVEFETLRGSLRQAAYGLETSFEEAQKLAEMFARISNTGAGGARGLGGEVGIGGGLARALGLAPGQGVGAMGTLRQFGASSDQDGSRRLALMIGEAVAHVGFAKSDEVLQVVTQFAASQARAALGAPNISGYLGAFSGLAGSGRAGLDAGGAAALLARVNSSIMGFGSAGEAGQNFMLANVGRPLGLSPVQTKILMQSGAFGTGRGTFGSGSLYGQFSARFGGRGAGAAGGSDATNLQMILGGLQHSYGALGPDMLASATSNLLGISETHAMAMHMYGARSMGSIERRLKGKVPMSSLSNSAFGALAAIQTGGADVLQGQAASLFGRKGADALSPAEAANLKKVMAGNDVDAQRQILTELTATREQEMTEGKQLRQGISGVENKIQELATALIPINMTARDALVAMAGVLAPESEFGKAKRQADEFRARGQAAGAVGSALDKFDAETNETLNSARGMAWGPNMRQGYLKQRAEARSALEYRLNRENFGDVGQYSTSADALTAAIMMQESGGRRFDDYGRPLANGSSTALGEMQVLDGTASDPGFGVKPARPGDLNDRARVGRQLLQKYMQIYGDPRKAAAAYKAGAGKVNAAVLNGGDQWLGQLDPGDQAYVQDVMKRMADPAGTNRGLLRGAEHDVAVNLTLYPKTPDGKKAGPPIKAKIGGPQASGVVPQ